MLQRCYDPYYINKEVSYIDCYVEEYFHNFQNFAKWHEENYYECNGEVMQLDKDILVKGNKIYSRETCIFVPQRINNLFTKRQNCRGKHPIGVSWIERDKVFSSGCCIYDAKLKKKKRKWLGNFDNEIEAFICYKNFKENYIKEVADEYKESIPIKLYEALYKYEVEIND